MREHTTKRGALLAAMEHRCLDPGRLWVVEGHQVRRYDGGAWCAIRLRGGQLGEPGSFEQALEYLADHLDESAGCDCPLPAVTP